jgi:hypothetical protein
MSFIIKNKRKTNVCVVLYSHEHGVGKNSVVELFMRLIDSKYISKIENIDDLHSQFNGFCENKFLIYGDEILAKNKDLYNCLKNTITRSEVKINKKGIDQYSISDLSNYIFTTNERHPFKIEENDRRISIINCSEKKMDDNICKEFYKLIKDEDILKSFYHEIINMKMPDKIECLNTELKREIQGIYMPSPIKYLFKNYRRLEDQKFNTNDLFEKIKEFEKIQGYTETKSSNQMSLRLKEVADFTYKSNDKRGYKFNNLAKILKEYNEEMFKDYELQDPESDDEE